MSTTRRRFRSAQNSHAVGLFANRPLSLKRVLEANLGPLDPQKCFGPAEHVVLQLTLELLHMLQYTNIDFDIEISQACADAKINSDRRI